MSNKNKNEFCKCSELAEKLEASIKDNERLAKTIRDLRQENDDLQTQWRNRPSGSNESRLGTIGDDNGYKERFEALVEINHARKKDYEELQMHFEMLNGEKQLLEDENRKLKGRIYQLEKRQRFLEDETARLAGALYAQQASDGGASSSEEQCELLKSQIVVYREDFERERQDRENLNEEKEKYKHKLEDAEEIIRKLTAELDAFKALEQVRGERRHYSENGYLNARGGIPRHQLQLVNPYVDERWRIEPRMEQHTFENCIPDSLTQGDKL